MSESGDLVYTVAHPNLPVGWALATIEDLVGKDGIFVDGDWIETKDQDPNGDVRLVQLADIGDGEYRNKSARFLTYERALRLGCTFLEKGDVLIARMPDPLGRACVFPGDPKKSVTAVDVAIVRPTDSEFNNRWLMYFVNAPAFRAAVASMQSGSTRKRISRKNLARIALPVPPRPQQNRIVAEIEKQFSRLEEAVANLKRVKAHLKRYKAAVLKAAVEGKLTEDWRKAHPDVEPASELLKRILTERRAKWNRKGKYNEPVAPDATNRPLLPQRWTLTTVGQLLTEPLCNGISVKGSDTPPGVRALRLSAMSDVGFDYSEVRYLPLSQDDVEDLWIEEGDFFISRGNGSLHLVGRGTPAQHLSEPTIFPDTMIRLRLTKYIRESGWLRIIWSSRLVRSQIERKVKTTAGIYKIAQPEVEQITIPVPPLLEQERIVTEVEQRFSVIATVEAQMAANFQRAERLRQTILQNAFNGTLYHHFRRPDDSGVNNTRR